MALLDANEDQLDEADNGELDWVVPTNTDPHEDGAEPETGNETEDEFMAMAAISKKRYGFAPKAADTNIILRHTEYRTIHWGHLVCPETKLGCGKKRGIKHEEIREIPEKHWPFCGGCFPC